MHPLDCPTWNYSSYRNHKTILRDASRCILKSLYADSQNSKWLCDTPATHHRLFNQLVSPGYEYFAGMFRGSAKRCLEYYDVVVSSDSRVGVHAPYVRDRMSLFTADTLAAISSLELAKNGCSGVYLRVSRELLLQTVITVAARVFVEFLTIHPFADGNGHIARFLVWAILVRYGLNPVRWPIDPRPDVQGYGEAITAYRDGNFRPLELMILNSLAPLKGNQVRP